MPEKATDPLANLHLEKDGNPPKETQEVSPEGESEASTARTQTPIKRGAIARAAEQGARRGWRRPVPAEYDSNVTPVASAAFEEMYERVRGIRVSGGKLYNKETFFRGGVQSSTPRLDEIQAANVRGTGNPGTHTREEIALEILTKAGVDKLYPELVFPLAEALEPILASQETAAVRNRATGRGRR